MKLKKIIGLGLATSSLLVSVAGCTNDTSDTKNKEVEDVEQPQTDKKDTKNTDPDSVPVVEDSKYINYRGTVSEVNVGKERQVIVDGEGEGTEFKNISFNISDDTVVVSDKTEDIIDIEKIKKGDNVEVTYDKDAPMTKSLPPITNAKSIALREAEGENKLGVKVSKFNEDLISEDNQLQLKINDDTSIVDRDGKELTKEDIVGKEIVAFYGPTETLSLPGQSTVKKIILLSNTYSEENTGLDENEEAIKTDDKIIINGEEITLEDKMYRSDERWMMPIRDVGVALGYDVKWNEETRVTELTKGNNYATANAKEDMYGFAKEIVQLGKASEIKNGRMYVPVSFIKDVLKLDSEVTEEGTIIVEL